MAEDRQVEEVPEGTFDLQELMAQIGLKDFMLTKCRAEMAKVQQAFLKVQKEFAELQVHCARIEGKLKTKPEKTLIEKV